MNKVRVYYHSKSETTEQIIERTAGKLRVSKGMELLASVTKLTKESKEEWNNHLNDSHTVMKERALEIEELCDRARTAETIEETLNILREEATLIDLDRRK